MTTQGRRRFEIDSEINMPLDCQPGDYWNWDGLWMCMTPSRFIGNLANHKITEHEDGTITVSPSILVTTTMAGEKRAWHGWLERGVWRQA